MEPRPGHCATHNEEGGHAKCGLRAPAYRIIQYSTPKLAIACPVCVRGSELVSPQVSFRCSDQSNLMSCLVLSCVVPVPADERG